MLPDTSESQRFEDLAGNKPLPSSQKKEIKLLLPEEGLILSGGEPIAPGMIDRNSPLASERLVRNPAGSLVLPR